MKRRAENVIDRRGILKTSAAVLGGALLKDDSVEATAQNINTHSGPSRLKITDLRVAVVTSAPMTCPIIRIDTNQGVYGLGEVRDGASPSYALMLKSRLLGESPVNVDRLFRKIRQFGGQARQAGGVCAVEMALWEYRRQGLQHFCLPDAGRQISRTTSASTRTPLSRPTRESTLSE